MIQGQTRFLSKCILPKEIFLYVLYDFYQVLIRDAPGISEKDENRSKSTKVTKVTQSLAFVAKVLLGWITEEALNLRV